MAKMATRGIEFEPIDRLEEKVKQLVDVIERLKAERASATDENRRLAREIEALQARVLAGESTTAELSALQEERDLIRTRVGEMLEQLEALNL